MIYYNYSIITDLSFSAVALLKITTLSFCLPPTHVSHQLNLQKKSGNFLIRIASPTTTRKNASAHVLEAEQEHFVVT